MKYKIEKVTENIKACLIYIDEIDEQIKELIKTNFLQIVKGKANTERQQPTEEDFIEAAKYVYMKKGKEFRVGIVGELLFHTMMQLEELSNEYMSVFPTIGYSDTFQVFYKGFDGIYYSKDKIWVCEVKSKKDKSQNVDYDNKDKLELAARQLKAATYDKELNRWNKAKGLVINQLSEKETKDIDIFKFLTVKSSEIYNQMLGTLIIKDKDEFNIEYIKLYANTLIDKKVQNQEILLICIRSFDYEAIIDFIKKEIGKNYEE